jgi:hypothetical protein
MHQVKMGSGVKTIIALLLLVQMGVAQDIVLKTSFISSSENSGVAVRLPGNVDVDGDGIAEVLMRDDHVTDVGYYLLNTVTYDTYLTGSFENSAPGMWQGQMYPQSENAPSVYLTQARSTGTAEWVYINPQLNSIRVYDILTGELILYRQAGSVFSVFDYDGDGLDDYILQDHHNEYEVYGIANGNPVAPPQDLAIHSSGDDLVISWAGVPTATAYRVLWSSSMDGTSFTRIGYTTETTFTHRSRASEPMGFYRVMSEDNGTGIVRMVGQTVGSQQ